MRPPSTERANAIASMMPPEKRASCHTTASEPSLPAAIDGRIEASRTAKPLALSTVPTACIVATVIGADQVAPLSVERMMRIVAVVVVVPVSSLNALINVPSGSTTITLPMVWLPTPGSRMGRAASHVAPLSVVRANQVGPPPLPATRRSHTTYT